MRSTRLIVTLFLFSYTLVFGFEVELKSRFARDVEVSTHPDPTIVALIDGEKNFISTCIRLNNKHVLCHKTTIPKSVQKKGKFVVVPNGLADLKTVTPDHLVPVTKFINLKKCGTGDLVLIRTLEMGNGTDALLPINLIPQGLVIIPYLYNEGQIVPNDGRVYLKTLTKYTCPSYFVDHNKYQFCAKWSSAPLNQNYTGAPVVYRANGVATASGFAVTSSEEASGNVELFSDVYPCVREIKERIIIKFKKNSSSSGESSSSASKE